MNMGIQGAFSHTVHMAAMVLSQFPVRMIPNRF